MGRSETSARAAGGYPRAVRRVLELFQMDCGKPYRLADLAEFAEVPSRTLQRQFHQFLGTSLSKKLQDMRLERCRRELLQAAPGASVAEVAQRCGFTHFGRFSASYSKRYGEAPSATLQRNSARLRLPPRSPLIFVPNFEPPTISIRPFDAAPDILAAASGIAEELIVALARSRTVRLVHSSSARYCLLGRLRREHKTLRLTLRLIHSASRSILWASSYDGLADRWFAFEECVSGVAAAAIRASLQAAEVMHARSRPLADLTAHEIALRVLPSVVALEKKAAAQALDLLGEALTRDPNQPLAAALAAWCHAQRVIYEFTANPTEERAKALTLARDAAANSSSDDSLVLAVLGNAYNSIHDLETAEIMTNKAVMLDGGSAWAWGRSGWIEAYRGNADDAIERLNIALSLNPTDALAPSFQTGVGCALFQAGKYASAAQWLERVVTERPSAVWAHRVLCPAYVHMGRKKEAARSLTALRAEHPDSTIAGVVSALPMTHDFLDRIADGLESAGLSYS